MPKLRGPILSLGATGGLTKLFSLARRMRQNIIERKPIPVDAKSPAQLFYRHMFTKCTALWHTLSEAEQAEWERLATPRHMTGYAWFISQCLRPNPGIYLPLQGGTMSGNIDMDKNRLLKLPLPTDNQEAATKAYADTHGMQAHEHTHTLGQADEIDSALALAAMAGLATGKFWIGNGAGRPFPIDFPAAGAVLVVAETEVFNGVSPNPAAWTDLDISAVVGSNVAFVVFKFYNPYAGSIPAAFRKNGETQVSTFNFNVYGISYFRMPASQYHYMACITDSSGIAEWAFNRAGQAGVTIAVVAYIK